MLARKFSVAFVALLLLGGYLLHRSPGLGSTQTNSACCGPSYPEGPRELDFAYYSLRDGFSSQLQLVSDSPKAIDLTIAIRDLEGETLLTSATIGPQAKLAFDLRALIAELGADPAGSFGEGSVAVYFVGTIMPVVGQITMTSATARLAHESEMVENDPGRTDIPAVLNGLWWNLGSGRDARIMVCNTSGFAATADVYLDFLGSRHSSAPLSFGPHETKVLSVSQLLADLKVSPAQAPQGGTTIVQRGGVPKLIAQGKILDPVTGFSTTLRFPSPESQPTSTLHASGLPIGTPSKDSPFAGTGTFVPHLIARNLPPTSQTVTVTVEYPTKVDSGGTSNSPQGASSRSPLQAYAGTATGKVVLAPLTLGPYATQDSALDSAMRELPVPLPYCSVRIEYSGPPASLIAELASVEQEKDLVVDSKLQDEGWGWAGSGANPWHLDDETESLIFLTDMGDRPVRIGFSVTANGTHYYLTRLKLNPHETRVIDLRRLRDAQWPDFKSNKIPAAAVDGSVSWIRLDNVPVMGRVVVIRRYGGMASNYDCCTCQCPASYVGCDINPPPPSCIGPHALMQMCCMATYQNCNGYDTYSDVTTAAIWTSSNTAVATMDTTTRGLVHGHAQGSANITASYTGTYYWAEQPPFCGSRSASYSYSCPVSVANSSCPDHLEVASDSYFYWSCKYSGQTIERDVKYDVVDANGSAISSFNVDEAFSGLSNNTCGNGAPTPSSCTAESYSFTDHLSVYCNSVGGSCGYTIKIQQWHWCPTGAAEVAIGTLNNTAVYNNSVTVLGKTVPPESNEIPGGTAVYP